MRNGKAPVIPLSLHPGFHDRRRINELKTALLAETLAFAQMALDNAEDPGRASARAERILKRACALLGEARERLMLELLSGAAPPG
jgi:hypothetical protein|uniref:Uncharacterized protein n=1 Tax=Desulfobacca acetoxidans TaxID=60893 RepID=A0A7C3SII2_9BACT